jgi:hypothetical protein
MAFSISLSFSGNTKADLIPAGLGVYDTALNITWTQNSKLLGALESSQGYNTIVSAVIAADPVIYDTPNWYFSNNGVGPYVYDNGTYNLSVSDFIIGGQVDWWGAQAFMAYLNAIDYDGSKQWRLPVHR